MEAQIIIRGFAAGALATLFMDALNYLAARAGLLALFRPALLGRWVAYMRRGELFHRDIRETPPVRGELVLGEVTHYAIGGLLGVVYVGVIHPAVGTAARSFLYTVGYGAATTAFAWLLLFPSWGFGLIGLKGPPLLKYTSLYNHINFGVGIWLFISIFI